MQPENYLVIDFEATCCDVGTIAREKMEIIEFGVVMVEAEGFQVVNEFQSFVRPELKVAGLIEVNLRETLPGGTSTGETQVNYTLTPKGLAVASGLRHKSPN